VAGVKGDLLGILDEARMSEAELALESLLLGSMATEGGRHISHCSGAQRRSSTKKESNARKAALP
jgi:hypothetical protein